MTSVIFGMDRQKMEKTKKIIIIFLWSQLKQNVFVIKLWVVLWIRYLNCELRLNWDQIYSAKKKSYRFKVAPVVHIDLKLW